MCGGVERERKKDANNVAQLALFHPSFHATNICSLFECISHMLHRRRDREKEISLPISFNAVSVDGCNGRRGRFLDADGDVWRWADPFSSAPFGPKVSLTPSVPSFPSTGNDSGSFNLHYRSSRYVFCTAVSGWILIEVSMSSSSLGLLFPRKRGEVTSEHWRVFRPSTKRIPDSVYSSSSSSLSNSCSWPLQKQAAIVCRLLELAHHVTCSPLFSLRMTAHLNTTRGIHTAALVTLRWKEVCKWEVSTQSVRMSVAGGGVGFQTNLLPGILGGETGKPPV